MKDSYGFAWLGFWIMLGMLSLGDARCSVDLVDNRPEASQEESQPINQEKE